MNVAVLGAGPRGRTVAELCLGGGHTVRLHDPDANAVMDAVDAVSPQDGTESVDGTTDLEGAVGDADLAVDATRDDVATRRELVADVEETCGDETLIATGDTTTGVTAVAAGLRDPSRALGLHPVEGTDLLEIVVAEQTDAETRERAEQFAETLDVTPMVVRDAPGFAVRRLELASIAEAVRLVDRGVASVDDIDRAAPGERGPLERADRMGLDTLLAALENLTERLDPRFEPPPVLREKVMAGELGASTGTGFYVWESGEPVEVAAPGVEPATREDQPGR